MRIRLKMFAFMFFAGFFVLLGIGCLGDNVSNSINDTKKLSALKNVTLTTDSAAVTPQLPQRSDTQKTFSQALAEDSATFANPANYGITITYYMLADNTSDQADDAKFDGVLLDIIMDTLNSEPIRTETGAFEIAKNETKQIPVSSMINLATHRRAGLYIFQQMVDGADVKTTVSPQLLYKIGSVEGSIDIAQITFLIPTRADEDTKAFLKGMLESGVFNEE